MNQNVEDMVKETMALDIEDRALLAGRLLLSLDELSPSEVEPTGAIVIAPNETIRKMNNPAASGGEFDPERMNVLQREFGDMVAKRNFCCFCWM